MAKEHTKEHKEHNEIWQKFVEEAEPLFKTEEDYEKFCEEYREKVVPILEEQRRRRILSLQEAQTRIVN